MNNTIEYYDNYDENTRLERDNVHKTEFITTTYILDNIIEKDSKILDLGAGTGSYSIYYGEKGHSVTAIDLSPKNVGIMSDKIQKLNLQDKIEAKVGDVRRIDFLENESYDVVLCMGPLYHLNTQEERLYCIENSLKKLKKNGVLAIAYINKFAVCISEIQKNKEKLKGNNLDSILLNGLVYGDARDLFYFTSPKEIEYTMERFKVNRLENIGTDGIGFMIPEIVNSFSDEEYDLWINHHLKTCKVSSINGLSLHGLYICKK